MSRIAGYTFQADEYCVDCVTEVVSGNEVTAWGQQAVEAALDTLAEQRNIDRQDERSFDSGDFPKVIFSIDVDADEGRCCGACGEVLS